MLSAGAVRDRWRRASLGVCAAVLLASSGLAATPARADGVWVRVPLEHLVQAFAPAQVWTNGASALDLEYTAEAASTFSVQQNEKPFPPAYAGRTGHADGRAGVFRVEGTSDPVRISVQWGFPEVNQHFTIRHVSGAKLQLVAVWVFGPAPEVVPQPDLPLLMIMGDSVAKGHSSGGIEGHAAGYSDRFGDRFRIANVSVGATTAVCHGQSHMTPFTTRKPLVAIIAYGTTDITGGGGAGCSETIDDFRAAITSMVDQIQAGSSDSRIYLHAILPRQDANDAQRPAYNQVLAEVAASQGVQFVDAGAVLSMPADYTGITHLTAWGHQKIAQAWDLVFDGPGHYALAVTRVGTGAGTVTADGTSLACGAVCFAPVDAGTPVVLRAAPAAGSLFGGWQGACAGQDPTCEITMGTGALVTASFVPEASMRPDAQIKPPAASTWKGNDVYNATGYKQTSGVSGRRGATKTLMIRVQNDGSLAKAFTIQGPGSGNGITLTYLQGATGSTDITAAVVAGSYLTPVLEPGATWVIRYRAAIGPFAALGLRSHLVRTSPQGAPAVVDAVRAKVRVK
jgi:hypothetical protein